MSKIQVEITDASEFHCFRMTLRPQSGQTAMIQHGDAPPPLEIMLHATALVDLIHQCSLALCEWQRQTTSYLILQKTGLTEDEARAAGLLA